MGAYARIHDAATAETRKPLTLAPPPPKKARKKPGLALWMERVLEECDRAGADLAADPVHDLRVALRRCRSMADGLRSMDPHPAWKQMKRAGKRLFSQLGELRDVQVMEEWIHRIGDPDDPVTSTLLQFLAGREVQLKQQAASALQEFDRKQWRRWITLLPRRAARVRAGSAVFRHLALERWTEAHELHKCAMRNRSQLAFHRLRIGLKRFRYIVENFLPAQHSAWSDDLKDLQDLLGEVHDLDVLWATALQVNAFPNPESRLRWHSRIIDERARRVEKYRGRMLGKASLWQSWRAQLPTGKEIEFAALTRLKLWASFLDPDFKHSLQVTRLALQLYDGLHHPADSDQRSILQVAALLHDVGRSRREKRHHKGGYDLIRKLTPPLSWSKEKLRWVGIVSRYHRGALPRAGQKTLAGLNAGQRQDITKLAGILRLANAFDCDRKGHIGRLEVAEHDGFVTIAAEGYSPRARMAEKIAGARHLLETVSHRPVMVKPLRATKPRPAATC